MGNRTSKSADQQLLLDDTDDELLFAKISVVLIGCHGVGKNTVGNAILKKKAFTFHDRSKNYYLKDENTTFGRHVSVTRVPGWSADLSSKKNSQIWQVIRDSVQSVEDGPHVIILVVDMNTEPAETTKAKLKEILDDEDVFQHILIISVDARKIVVTHSARKQTIVNRCKYHFWRCTCGTQNKKIIETIEDFIIYKHDIRFYFKRKKAPNLELQYQELVNLVDRLKHKLSVLNDTLESKNAEIRELHRVLKEKEKDLRDMEDKMLNSYENPKALSVSHEKSVQMKHAAQLRKMEEEFERKMREMKKELEEKNKEIDELKSKSNEESKKLRKEIQTLKSQNKNKKRSKPLSVPGPSLMDADSFELTSVIPAGVQFLRKYRKELTERIVAVKPIADDLLQTIGRHKYEKILQAPNEYDQRRELCDIVDKGGKKLQVEFYECLKKHEKYLVEDLEESQ